MASRLGKISQKGSKASSSLNVVMLNGNPALQVNWHGRIYAAPLTLSGSSGMESANIKSAIVGDLRIDGDITFGIGGALYNRNNRINLTGGTAVMGDKNIAIGNANALSSVAPDASNNIQNLAIGVDTLQNAINGQYNIALGYLAMGYMGKHSSVTHTNNQANIAIGVGALTGKSSAYRPQAQSNIAIGTNAMNEAQSHDDTDGTTSLSVMNNVCIGHRAGEHVRKNDNVYIGYQSGYGATANTTVDNVGIGTNTFHAGETANQNVAIGCHSAELLTTGAGNVFIGFDSGDTCTTGGDNICIGAGSDVSGSGASGQVAIGHDVVCDADNKTLIKNTSIELETIGSGTTLTSATSNTTAGTYSGLTIDVDKTGSSTSNNTIYGINLDVDNTSATNGTNYMYGIRNTPTLTHAADAGTTWLFGLSQTVTGHANGSAVGTGIFNVVTGSDTNRGIHQRVDDTGIDIILESSANASDECQISTTTNGATKIETIDADAALAHLTLDPDGDLIISGADTKIDATKKLYLDGGTETYICEAATDRLDFVVGGDTMFRLYENGADGNQVSFFTSSVGFTRIEQTFSTTDVKGTGGTDDTDIDFRHSNKYRLEMTGDIAQMNLIFPSSSGNFLLVCTTNGDHDVTAWKVWENDETAATTTDVMWAGGSVPAFTNNGIDIVSFYWDATEQQAYGVASLAFATP